MIPKGHYAKQHNVPDAVLSEMMVTAKRLVRTMGVEEYNLVMNNGSEAGQLVPHAHLHIIPKSAEAGVEMTFRQGKLDATEGARVAEEIATAMKL